MNQEEKQSWVDGVEKEILNDPRNDFNFETRRIIEPCEKNGDSMSHVWDSPFIMAFPEPIIKSLQSENRELIKSISDRPGITILYFNLGHIEEWYLLYSSEIDECEKFLEKKYSKYIGSSSN